MNNHTVFMKEEYTENDKIPKLLMCKYSMQVKIIYIKNNTKML